jgi:SAM-dependent methyltransferase
VPSPTVPAEVPPASSRQRRWRADLRRSLHLLREFRFEQPDPARFYTALARDSAAQVGQYVDLEGATLLDVGGGPGYFRDEFVRAGASYFSVDVDSHDVTGAYAHRVVGSGMQLPFRSAAFDVAYSSNVLEHVPDPWRMADEMLRVVRPGGVVFISYTVWFGPWGGHETAPWHFLGGAFARRRYARKHARQPKNRFGESLFAVTVTDGLRWSRTQQQGEVLDVTARYNPRWAHLLLHIPILREVTTWNLVLVLRRR